MVKPMYARIGGKRRMLKYYRELYPKDFSSYAELFFGAGAVYGDLMEGFKGKTVINDLDKNIYNFLVAVRDSPEEVLYWSHFINDQCKEVKSPSLYKNDEDLAIRFKRWFNEERAKINAMADKDSVEYVARLFMLNEHSFGNKMSFKGEKYTGTPGPWSLGTLKSSYGSNFNQWSGLLQETEIYNLSYEEVPFEKENAFIYLDPPYLNADRSIYSDDFAEKDLQVGLIENAIKWKREGALVWVANNGRKEEVDFFLDIAGENIDFYETYDLHNTLTRKGSISRKDLLMIFDGRM